MIITIITFLIEKFLTKKVQHSSIMYLMQVLKTFMFLPITLPHNIIVVPPQLESLRSLCKIYIYKISFADYKYKLRTIIKRNLLTMSAQILPVPNATDFALLP